MKFYIVQYTIRNWRTSWIIIHFTIFNYDWFIVFLYWATYVVILIFVYLFTNLHIVHKIKKNNTEENEQNS